MVCHPAQGRLLEGVGECAIDRQLARSVQLIDVFDPGQQAGLIGQPRPLQPLVQKRPPQFAGVAPQASEWIHQAALAIGAEIALAQNPSLGVVADDRENLSIAAGRERHRKLEGSLPRPANVRVDRLARADNLILALP